MYLYCTNNRQSNINKMNMNWNEAKIDDLKKMKEKIDYH